MLSEKVYEGLTDFIASQFFGHSYSKFQFFTRGERVPENRGAVLRLRSGCTRTPVFGLFFIVL
jgi:hypothetical protein